MFTRKCPQCTSEITYKRKISLNKAVKAKSLCRACSASNAQTKTPKTLKHKGRVSFPGKKNPMYGKSFYDVWVEKFGVEEADRKLIEHKAKHSIRRSHKAGLENITEELNRKISEIAAAIEAGPEFKLFPDKHGRYKGNGNICGTYLNNLKCNAKNRDIEVFITLDDIWKQSEKQSHRCIFTGRPLVFPNDSSQAADKTFWNASVDRIDSKGDYTADNIQIIDKSLQKLKRDLSNEEFLSLVMEIARAQDNTGRN